jgi:hypothetical protein
MGGNFAILNPCTKNWSDLEGNGRARFCETCRTHVHSIAQYSPEEWNRLWHESNGHVCGFLGSSPPVLSRRTILFGAILTLVSPLFAANGRVRFRVKDPIGGLVKDADVWLADTHYQPLRTLTTDQSGEVLFTNLPLGDLRFVVRATGFRLKYMTIPIHNYKELKIEATIEVGGVGQTIYSEKHSKYKGWLQY